MLAARLSFEYKRSRVSKILIMIPAVKVIKTKTHPEIRGTSSLWSGSCASRDQENAPRDGPI